MSKGIKTDISLMNSRRSLLQLEKIKEDKANQSESNIIFSENTQADNSLSEDMQPYLSVASSSKEKQLLEALHNQRLQSVWLFVLNKPISEENEQRIRKIYLCPERYKQAKVVLPIFKFTLECRKFIKRLSQSSPWFKYKVVVDSYNATAAVQEFKNNQSVTQIYIFNDIKEEGLDYILPLKKKTTKIVGIYNSLLSLVMKCEKQVDYRFGFIQKMDDDERQAVIPIYPNRFPQISLIPNSFNSEKQNNLTQLNNFIAKSIGLPIQDKKNQVQKFFAHLKDKFNDNNQLFETIQKLEDQNHISPIVSEERAVQIFRLYLGLDMEVDHQNDKKDGENNVENLFDYILTLLREKKSLRNLQLGLNQIFHCIKQLSRQTAKQPEETESFPQNPNMTTIDPSKPNEIQVELQDNIKTNTKAFSSANEYCYKFLVFPVDHVGKIDGKFIQIQEFCEFYADLKTAEKKFNLNHSLINNKTQQSAQKYSETMYNKVCFKLKLPAHMTKQINQQTFIVDYGILQIQKICDHFGIQAPERWKSVCLPNIMSVFKVQKVQMLKISSKFTVSTVCLESTTLKNIFVSDPNYLSIHQLKILNFYKRTNVFKALNGNYRQLMRSKGKRNNQTLKNSSNALNLLYNTSLEKTQRIDVRSHFSPKDFYMKSVLQITQNSSKVGPMPIQQLNLIKMNSYIEDLKDEYLLVGSRHESLKKRITRLRQNAVTAEQSSYHNQKLLAMIQELYRYEQELYQVKFKLEDYHSCSYHLQNMETLLIKYPHLNGQFKPKELNIVAKRAEMDFRKGNLIQAKKGISSILEPLYLMIEKEEAENMSICSGKYFRYIVCSCLNSKDEKEELFRQVLKILANPNAQSLEDMMTVLNIFGQLLLTERRLRHYFEANSQRNDDMPTVIGRYLSQKLINSLERVQNGNNQNVSLLAEYNRLIGLFSLESDTKSTHYLKAIEILQKTEPYSKKSALYFEQLGNSLKQKLISNKLNMNKPSTSVQSFIHKVNECLGFYQSAVQIYECHKNTQIQVIRNLNSILEVLIALNQVKLVDFYVNDKIIAIFTKQSKSTACRSQIAHCFYILSIKAELEGNFNLSLKMIHKSLMELENSLQKQNISTYQIILKLSTPYFTSKFQQIKLSILMNKPTENNLEDLKWLKKVYDEHYTRKNHPNLLQCQLYSKFHQIQALYWLHKKSPKKYYKFTFKQIYAMSNNQNKKQDNQKDYIGFNKLCLLAMKFLPREKVGAQIEQALVNQQRQMIKQKIYNPLIRKIQLMYYEAVKAKSLKKEQFKVENANESFSRIEPSFLGNQQLNMDSVGSLENRTTKDQNWQCLYWKYHFVKGLHLKATKGHKQSLKSLKKAIELGKKSHLNKWIQLKIYQRTKEQLKKMDKPIVKTLQVRRYTILVYEVELKYIMYVIECVVAMKIFVDREEVEECQNFIKEIFLIINRVIGGSETGDIEEVKLDDFTENRMIEIGSQIIKHLTAHKLLDSKQQKSISQEIKFYSTPQNLSLSLKEIFQPIYRQIQSKQDQSDPDQPQQDELLFKQIVTDPGEYSQIVQEALQALNQKMGVYEREQDIEEIFQKLTLNK